LCSVRAPRLRPQGAAEPEPWAREAKECLRKAAVGAAVDVTLEYSRTIPASVAGGGDGGHRGDAPELKLEMGNVAVSGKQGPQQLAEMLVRRGLAVVQARCCPFVDNLSASIRYRDCI
jgi:hypothetical protein